MISDPDKIRYACIARKTTILYEFNPDSPLQPLAHQCLNQTPPNHTIFSHTARNCTFTFLIDDPFVFFAIFDDKTNAPDRIWFLNRLKEPLHDLIGDNRSRYAADDGDGNFTPYCFQGGLHSVIHRLVSESSDFDESNKENMGSNDGGSRSSSMDLSNEGSRRSVSGPLSANMGEGLKQKKKLSADQGGGETKEMIVENKVDLPNGNGVGGGQIVSKEVVVCHKAGGLCFGDGVGKRAKRIWRKHVWVVLVLDLALCLIMLGVWLCICQGLQCLEG